MVDPSQDAVWMREAVALASNTRPSPNPRVGAVVVRDGVCVGRGAHLAPGQDHGEVAAIKDAGSAPRGATVYVTMEPCNHHGRTPPCTDALIAAGVARVVVGVRDPNPGVRGDGITVLRNAGIDVTLGVEHDACAALVQSWSAYIRRATPYLVLKTGMSLDGRIATRTGESRWITSPDARRDAHGLRAHADAVLVGVGTVLADNPSLTPRDVPLPRAPLPVRVVLDSNARMPLDSILVATACDVPTWVVCADDADLERKRTLQSTDVVLIEVPRVKDRVSLHDAMRVLAARGLTEVLVEGGGTVHGALLDAGLGDRVVCYVAGVLLGGVGARPAFGGKGVARLSDARRLGPMDVRPVGRDLRIEAEFQDVHGDHHAGR